ncbi:MAG: hypothetical protein CL398_01650 [Acidiferrobacteraceae bacterium]|nr:hypothetical protein [Acidiferrobacteraceae bacterium]|tara:strand:- start:3857 stop:4432 length:576 start_codon:yes stop_codon:yes gene_type:complete
MNMDYLSDAAMFLVDTVLGFYITIIVLRLLFQVTQADFYNPISQMIVKLSNPSIRHLGRLFPTIWRVDIATVSVALILEGSRVGIITLLEGGQPRISGISVEALANLLRLSIWLFVVAIFLRAILSWVSTTVNHPIYRLVVSLTEPLMQPVRRFLPNTHPIDLSPIVLFIILMLARKLIVQPLADIARVIS